MDGIVKELLVEHLLAEHCVNALEDAHGVSAHLSLAAHSNGEPSAEGNFCIGPSKRFIKKVTLYSPPMCGNCINSISSKRLLKV